MFLRVSRIEPMNEDTAKAAGELCGRAGTSDIVDAAVVAGAASRGDDILTGDVGDIGRLAASASGAGRVLDLGQIRP
jgi:hypothetical protein